MKKPTLMPNDSDDIEIDLGSIFGKKKDPKKEHPKENEKKEEHKHSHSEEKNNHEHKHTHTETAHKKEEKKTEDDEDDAQIDFSGITKFFKGGSKEKKNTNSEHHREPKETEEDIGINFQSIAGFFNKYPWLITVLLILLVVGMSTAVRMESANLPFTDRYSQDTVYNYFRQQIGAQVDQQNPNLPSATRDQVINENYAKFYKDNKGYVDQQVHLTSLYFKTAWSNEPAAGDCTQSYDWLKCKPYMPDIDPYYWLRYAKNIEEHGYPGDIKKDGVDWDNHMLAPNGRPVTSPDTFHPYMLAYLHKIIAVFIPGITLDQSIFFFPVIIMAISSIIVFLIARRIAGNTAGLFASAMFLYSGQILNRTLFGHVDTDPWVIFFPVLITWLYLEAFETDNILKLTILTALAGFFVGMFSFAWGGWWYIFDFILAMTGIYLFYHFATNYKTIIRNPLSSIGITSIRNGLLIFIAFIAFSGISVTIFNDFSTFATSPISSLGFTRLKDAVLPTLWPNVLTTVAELNEGNIGDVINSVGGPMLFWVGLMGIACSMLTLGKEKKKYLGKNDGVFLIASGVWYAAILYLTNQNLSIHISSTIFIAFMFVPIIARAAIAHITKKSIDIGVAILLTIWLAGTTYASFKGIRFIMLMVPAYAVAFGVFIGVIYILLTDWLRENTNLSSIIKTSITLIVFFALFYMWFWPPGLMYMRGGNFASSAYSVAHSDVPLINDAWWNTLTAINKDSKPNDIISSWWDFGHHFKSIADRPVTFDGTTQDKPQAHWIGKSLLTNSELEAKGILQMLSCGGNNAFDELNAVKNDTVKSVKILNELHVADKAQALDILTQNGLTKEEADKILQYTHCENPAEIYFISSEDMVQKSGVWAHFGSWNFERSYIWSYLREKTLEEATEYMVSQFNYTQKQAEDTYFEIQTLTDQNAINAWVAPWPGYAAIANCQTSANLQTLNCQTSMSNQVINAEINLATHDASVVASSANGMPAFNGHPKSLTYVDKDEVKITTYPGSNFGFSIILVPTGTNSYNIVLCSPEMAMSMFTRTFYLQGHGLKYFKPFTHQTSISGTSIYTYKINWTGSAQKNRVEAFYPRVAAIDYIGYFENGTVFDSSIIDWQNKNITPKTAIESRTDTIPLTFTPGKNQIVSGLDLAVQKMNVSQTSTVVVPPELGYGTNPESHPLGNKTLTFKTHLISFD